ncbi:MAG: hypothetical protein ACRDO7_14020 [Nocardioidaceae bacterium]
MLTGPVSRTTPPRRRSRVLSAGTSLLAAFAFLAASLAVLVVGAHTASATEARSAGHTVGTNVLAGHQPNDVRVTPTDRSDAPQHRAAPWTPVADAPDAGALVEADGAVEHGIDANDAWHPYDVTPAHGRAPPH